MCDPHKDIRQALHEEEVAAERFVVLANQAGVDEQMQAPSGREDTAQSEGWSGLRLRRWQGPPVQG